MYGVMKMLNYLLDLDISPEEIYDINHKLDGNIIEVLEISKNRVKDTINYYKEIGITNITNLIITRPDLVILDKEDAENMVNKMQDNLFIDIVNNNVEDLKHM